ncbi:hypothetical protein HYV79_03190 [Candidatus Woesearchaeota archaeon]|nr:hypothetical protein [Candidatus Woesearchaeota archaeon]
MPASGRRNKLEIIYDILKAMHDKGGRIKPTHLLYKSNLSHQRMKEYVDELKIKGLIAEEQQSEEKYLYALTTQGYDFLSNYQKLHEFTETFGL